VQLQRSEQGRAAGLRERGQTTAQSRDGRDARRMGCGSCESMVAEIVVGVRRREQRKDPCGSLLRSGVPLNKPEN